MKLLEVKHLTKTFDGKKILDDVNLVIPEGRIIGLLGKNGAGKSTLIKSINDLLTIDEGEILFKGKKIGVYSKENISYLPLTIRMSEELTAYLKNADIKVAFLHNEIQTLERLQIVHDLRTGKYDCVVGVNLLREGIDIPEVSLIAILDADKQGFLRSTRSLIQTIGRAARNANGKVIMYADTMSESMDEAIKETYRRREIQMKFNEEHGITPTTIKKPIMDVIRNKDKYLSTKPTSSMPKKDREKIMKEIENEMMKAAKELDFERATELRDILFEMRSE